jgi:hypothetical protein
MRSIGGSQTANDSGRRTLRESLMALGIEASWIRWHAYQSGRDGRLRNSVAKRSTPGLVIR